MIELPKIYVTKIYAIEIDWFYTQSSAGSLLFTVGQPVGHGEPIVTEIVEEKTRKNIIYHVVFANGEVMTTFNANKVWRNDKKYIHSQKLVDDAVDQDTIPQTEE